MYPIAPYHEISCRRTAVFEADSKSVVVLLQDITLVLLVESIELTHFDANASFISVEHCRVPRLDSLIQKVEKFCSMYW